MGATPVRCVRNATVELVEALVHILQMRTHTPAEAAHLRGPASGGWTTAHMNSGDFAAPGGRGLGGLAKELRDRCQDVIKLQGWRIPK